MWKVSGIKSEFTAGRYFFWGAATEKCENMRFFRKTFRHRKFSSWKSFGTGTIKTATDSAFRISIRKRDTFFYHLLVVRSRLRATKCYPLAKIWDVTKKSARSFQNRALFFCNTAIFILLAPQSKGYPLHHPSPSQTFCSEAPYSHKSYSHGVQ